MQDVELLERLLEAHRQIGSLQSEISNLQNKLAYTESDLEYERRKALDSAHICQLMEEAINEDHWVIPLTKLYRAITGMGLKDSKHAIDHSRLGKLIRSNMRE